MKLTPHKIHAIIRKEIGELSSKYSVSQRIDRTTYEVYNGMKFVIGVLSSKYINEICTAFDNAGVKYESELEKGIIKIRRVQ